MQLVGTDWAILSVAAVIAVGSLVRLMVARRDSLMNELFVEAETEQRRKAAVAKILETKQKKAAKRAA